MKRLTLNDFEMGQLLGVGTVGTVYSGRLKATREPVAIKLLKPTYSQDSLVRARFQREMTILEKLNHPHIIRYYGGGDHNGQLFYAMEPVTAGSVKDLLEKFVALSWREVASIARQVCSALQYAHNHGIIHRDLKPGNLFLDQAGHIKLGDFGIARDTRLADLSGAGLTVGTHAYMSPEQIIGDKNISGKADLYSLGCVLFELLTGQKPFQGPNFEALFEQHLHQPPPKATNFVADCPQMLSDAIEQLLAKDPEQRPFNARAVQGAMIALLADADTPRQAIADNAANDSAVAPLKTPSDDFPSSDDEQAEVEDAGMLLLARKLHATPERHVSWRALAVLGLIAAGLVGIAMLASSN